MKAANARDGSMPAFMLFAQDFLASERVRTMSPAEVGIFILLLCNEWIEGSIPDAPRLLARLVSLPEEEFLALWEGVCGAFVQADGQPERLVNLRLEKERSLQEEHRRKKSEAGKKGNAIRWSQEPSPTSNGSQCDHSAITKGSPSQSQSQSPTPSQSPTQSPSVSISSTSAATRILDPTEGVHQRACDIWCKVHLEEVGTRYPFMGGKDGKALKRLTAAADFNLEEMERRARLMFNTPFWADAGIDLTKFVSQWAALGNASRQVASRRVIEPHGYKALREIAAEEAVK